MLKFKVYLNDNIDVIFIQYRLYCTATNILSYLKIDKETFFVCLEEVVEVIFSDVY